MAASAALQPDCLGCLRLRLVASSAQGPGQGNALLVFGLIIEAPSDSKCLRPISTYNHPGMPVDAGEIRSRPATSPDIAKLPQEVDSRAGPHARAFRAIRRL